MSSSWFNPFDARRITLKQSRELGAVVAAGRVWTRAVPAEGDTPGTPFSLTLTLEAEAARDKIVSGNVRLALGFCVRRFRQFDKDAGIWEDLQQAALTGLWDAVERWDPVLAPLSSHAEYWMRRRTTDLLVRAGYKTYAKAGRTSGGDRIPAQLETSMSAPARGTDGRDPGTLGDRLADPDADASQEAELSQATDYLCGILDRVAAKGPAQARTMEIIRRSIGVCGCVRPSTLEEIGRSMGISRERVRQLRNQGAGYIAQETGANAKDLEQALTSIAHKKGPGLPE